MKYQPSYSVTTVIFHKVIGWLPASVDNTSEEGRYFIDSDQMAF